MSMPITWCSSCNNLLNKLKFENPATPMIRILLCLIIFWFGFLRLKNAFRLDVQFSPIKQYHNINYAFLMEENVHNIENMSTNYLSSLGIIKNNEIRSIFFVQRTTFKITCVLPQKIGFQCNL